MGTLKRITIMAGGTGGHVFPGLAIAQAFQQAGVSVSWLGTEGGMEQAWVTQAGLPFDAIKITGLRGKGALGWLKAPVRVAHATLQALRILQARQADAVLGMGGFVCGPGALAAKSLGLPLFIHEQNAIAGLTNRLLAPLSQRVYAAFPFERKPLKNAVIVGNPVRHEIEQIPLWQPHSGPWRILVVGGSRGALALNETVPFALKQLNVPYEVCHQAGEKTLAQAKAAYAKAGVQGEVVPFIEDMAQAYAWADMVICRAGALTVSEMMAAKRAAVFVPYPYAVDNHQAANAKVVVDLGAGAMIPQKVLTAERLSHTLNEWLRAARLAQASERLVAAYQPGAAQRMVQDILEQMA